MDAVFNNGIDLAQFLWRSDEHPEGLALSKDIGGILDEDSIAGVTRHHNNVVSQLADRLSMATKFQFSDRISIIWKPGNLWSVFEAGLVLNADGDWEEEPLGSSRTAEFKRRTRFSLEEAFERAKIVVTAERL
jgi:hypothetical protein